MAEFTQDLQTTGELLNGLATIIRTDIPAYKEEITKEVAALKELNGYDKISSGIDLNVLINNAFDRLTELTSNAMNKTGYVSDEILEYSKGNPNDDVGLKILATTLMAGSKIGEGFLSGAEGVLDTGAYLLGGVLTPLAYLSGGSEAVEDLWSGTSKFIAEDWSNDLFSNYYNSDLAKYSIMAEDSAAANWLRVGGKIGFYVAGAAVLGGTPLASSAQAKIAATKVPLLANISAQTLGGGALTFAASFGETAQSDFQEGKGVLETGLHSLGEGTKDAGTALVLGTVADNVVAARAARAAKKAASSADDIANAATNSSSDIANATTSNADDLANATTNSSSDIANSATSSTDDVIKQAQLEEKIADGSISDIDDAIEQGYSAKDYKDVVNARQTVDPARVEGLEEQLADGSVTNLKEATDAGFTQYEYNAAKAANSSADDVLKAATSSTDDAARAVASSTNDAASAATNSAGKKTAAELLKDGLGKTGHALKEGAKTAIRQPGLVVNAINDEFEQGANGSNPFGQQPGQQTPTDPGQQTPTDPGLGVEQNQETTLSQGDEYTASQVPDTGGGGNGGSPGSPSYSGYESLAAAPKAAESAVLANAKVTDPTTLDNSLEKVQPVDTTQQAIDPTQEASNVAQTPTSAASQQDNITKLASSAATPATSQNLVYGASENTPSYSGYSYDGETYEASDIVEDLLAGEETDLTNTLTASIDDVISDGYSTIPTSSAPVPDQITLAENTPAGKLISASAGVAAAAAAGLGTNYLMNRPDDNDDGDDEELTVEDWKGEPKDINLIEEESDEKEDEHINFKELIES